MAVAQHRVVEKTGFIFLYRNQTSAGMTCFCEKYGAGAQSGANPILRLLYQELFTRGHPFTFEG